MLHAGLAQRSHPAFGTDCLFIGDIGQVPDPRRWPMSANAQLRASRVAGRSSLMRYAVDISAFLAAACSGPSRDEVAWANSPDGLTHAILSETNGGATTSVGYVIELHPALHKGEQPVEAGI